MWIQLAILIASMVVSYALRPKPEKPQPTAFGDIEFPQAAEGTPQAVVFGDVWTSDWMVLGVGNYRTTEIHSSQGKK